MIKIFKASLYILVLLAPITAGAQSPEERIVSYHSDIEVKEDSSLIVKETIKVVSAGDQIRRGIYRDFPIVYNDRFGRRYNVGFELLSVTRDGSDEPYHIEHAGNGLRIYIGEESVFIPTGEHEYTLSYKTTRQLGFFEDHDELYWNVTGNGWVFPIDSATATVQLPAGVPNDKITTTFYTGLQGSTAQDGTAAVNENNTIAFSATNPLGPNEGLTIVTGWPKGIIAPPSATQNFMAAIASNFDYVIGILGLLFVLGLYFYMWNKRGRDPKPEAIIPMYEAPRGLSPAFLRFVRRMGSDNRGFAAAIISLGAKNRLTITEKKSFLKKTYTLTKKEGSSKAALSDDEQLLEKNFFSGRNSIGLETSNAATISKIREKFNDILQKQAGKQYFAKNTAFTVFGILLSIGVFIATIVSANYVRFGIVSFLQVLFWPFLFLSLLIINIVFGRLMRAFTGDGRKLADEIEGFKLFLSVTEKDRLAFHNPPERTPELFEKMLPYALALGVEHKWAGQFADVFARLENKGANYAPAWYYGTTMAHFNADSFASSVGSSFTGVVSSSSTPPGSSSGSSGGSSGGGGGGGGGGGW